MEFAVNWEAEDWVSLLILLVITRTILNISVHVLRCKFLTYKMWVTVRNRSSLLSFLKFL